MILYPEYMGQPETWKRQELPAIPTKVESAISSLGSVAGVPRFRIVDATKAIVRHEGDAELPAGDYLAYAALMNVARQDGFTYADGEGFVRVARAEDVPKGKLALPYTTYEDFGIPRYMVEVYRDFREPGVEESGYQWAWTIDVKEVTTIEGVAVEISRFRLPSEWDVEHARQMLRLIESATKETIKASAERFMAKREARTAEQKQNRREAQAEAVEKFIRDRF